MVVALFERGEKSWAHLVVGGVVGKIGRVCRGDAEQDGE